MNIQLIFRKLTVGLCQKTRSQVNTFFHLLPANTRTGSGLYLATTTIRTEQGSSLQLAHLALVLLLQVGQVTAWQVGQDRV
jgi:hypothetical protein